MTNTIKTIETCIFWQKLVLSQSKDKRQKERAKKAIETLELEFKQLQHNINEANEI